METSTIVGLWCWTAGGGGGGGGRTDTWLQSVFSQFSSVNCGAMRQLFWQHGDQLVRTFFQVMLWLVDFRRKIHLVYPALLTDHNQPHRQLQAGQQILLAPGRAHCSSANCLWEGSGATLCLGKVCERGVDRSCGQRQCQMEGLVHQL